MLTELKEREQVQYKKGLERGVSDFLLVSSLGLVCVLSVLNYGTKKGIKMMVN